MKSLLTSISKLRSVGYGWRAFALYFVILGGIIWFTLGNAIERLNDGMRQSAESVLVDVAHILSGIIETESQANDSLNTQNLKHLFEGLGQKRFLAQIYQVTKTQVDMQVYVTDGFGKVVYDSTGLNVGADFSRWRDVQFTLQGKYGARTSYIDQERREPEDPQAMYVAAPISVQGELLGVVTVVKPVASLDEHLLTGTRQLQRYAFALLALALILGYFLSLWFTRSLQSIADYANQMAMGKTVSPPDSPDQRLTSLTQAISNLRAQLDGKEYVENYIHGLTHELKTPITSIQGAVELIDDAMPDADRQRFLNNIENSNRRMARLVDRMLSLAKLESATDLSVSDFDLGRVVQNLIHERSQWLKERRLTVVLPEQKTVFCQGDRVLLSQAIASLLDNAIRFAHADSQLLIAFNKQNGICKFELVNKGDAIPDYALDKLYDRFFSLASDGISGSKSTGLGLSFAKQIMKLHNGTISVTNTKNGVLAELHWPENPPDTD